MLFKNEIELAGFIQLASGQGKKLLLEAESVEYARIIPAIGESLYQKAVDAVANPAGLPAQPDPIRTLVKLCRQVTAPFMAAQALPTLGPALGENGLIIKSGGDDSREAFQWEYREVLEAHHSRGYAAQETLLRHLRTHAADYPEFTDAPVNSPDRFQLIQDGRELAKCLSVQQPYRAYLILLPFFQIVVDLYLDELMTRAEYEALTGRILAGALLAEDQELLRYLRPAVARLAIKHAAAELSIQFSATGFTIIDKIADAPEAGRRSPDSNRLDRLIAEMQNTSDAYSKSVTRYLNSVASDTLYPDYFHSSLFVSPAPATGAVEQKPYDTASRHSFRM